MRRTRVGPLCIPLQPFSPTPASIISLWFSDTQQNLIMSPSPVHLNRVATVPVPAAGEHSS